MPLSQDLRNQHRELWERMVTHPFVQAMGLNALSSDQLRRYFLQDYVFLRDFVALLALGVAKAPDIEVARRLAAFLAEVLQGEEGLFRRSFREWGLRPEQYSPPEAGPAATAFGNLMTRVAYEGAFPEILTVLVVTEWTYLDWATRLVQAGRIPKTQPSGDWVEIHSNEAFREFVEWLLQRFDALHLSPEQRDRAGRLFHTTLRYELAFWEASWSGEAWLEAKT